MNNNKKMVTGVLTNAINKYLLTKAEATRDYIGASDIGHPCLRQIWYKYNKAQGSPFSSSTYITFDIGHTLEALLINYLIATGISIWQPQSRFIDKNIPQFQGTPDAIIMKNDDPEAIVEIKTARDSSFKIFMNQGLFSWNESYYAQVQSYMGLSDIHEAYLIAINKDTSEIHDELIMFDAEYYGRLIFKAERVINSLEAPDRINNTPFYHVCRACKFKTICHTT